MSCFLSPCYNPAIGTLSSRTIFKRTNLTYFTVIEADLIQGFCKSTMLETETMHFISESALKIMNKMGYKQGSGLGKQSEGRINPLEISGNPGTRGLGVKMPDYEASKETWDFSLEATTVAEEIKWISDVNTDTWYPGSFEKLLEWIVRGPPKLCIDNENKFCDATLLCRILKAKDIFNELDVVALSKARCRANPFETIRSAFFMNRAALKIANIDAVTNFIFTEIDRNPNHSRRNGPYYFADVCAGPGGFTEYILWRKKWVFKAFGFTLKAVHDFELDESQCVSPVTFSAHYGSHGDGDICNPDNIKHFSERVVHGTEGDGVHFMMADGGFSVEGNENLQEILSKQLYVCQCLVALKIVRTHGHFVTKLFDLFTEFSVGLIYLMYKSFEKVTIFKPNTSRPANAERYLICYGLKDSSHKLSIIQYLTHIAQELWDLRLQNNTTIDINEIVPLSVITADEAFFQFIVESNHNIGARQVVGLHKLAVFCRNPQLFEPRQEELRKKCLEYWRIPDKPKAPMQRFTTDDLLNASISDPGFMLAPPKLPKDLTHLGRLLKNTNDWYFTTLSCTSQRNTCSFYAGVGGSRVFRLLKSRWVRVKRLKLVCGTLLYGEMVKEYQKDEAIVIPRQSLHVIDAVRLGDISLCDLPFDERYNLIQTYCRAVNHESHTNYTRIRPKDFYPLNDTKPLNYFTSTDENEPNYYTLQPLGFNSVSEYYLINSVLLLRTHGDQHFTSTFLKRIHVYFNKEDSSDDNGKFFNRKVTAKSVIEFFKSGD